MKTPSRIQHSILIIVFAVVCVFGFSATSVFATSHETVVEPARYTPLVGIPGMEDVEFLNTEGYVEALYYLAITVAAILAVYQILFGGIRWMFDGIATHKEEAKSQIQGAVFGLLIVLSAVLVLETINVDLTNLNIFGNAPALSVAGGEGGDTTGFDVSFGPEPIGSTTNWDSLDDAGKTAFTENCSPGVVNITPNAASQNIATCVTTDDVIVDPDLVADTVFNTNTAEIMDDFLLKQDQIANDVGTDVQAGDLKGYTSVPIDEIPGNDEIAFSQTLQPACEAAGGSHIGITMDAGAYEFWCVGNSGVE